MREGSVASLSPGPVVLACGRSHTACRFDSPYSGRCSSHHTGGRAGSVFCGSCVCHSQVGAYRFGDGSPHRLPALGGLGCNSDDCGRGDRVGGLVGSGLGTPHKRRDERAAGHRSTSRDHSHAGSRTRSTPSIPGPHGSRLSSPRIVRAIVYHAASSNLQFAGQAGGVDSVARRSLHSTRGARCP